MTLKDSLNDLRKYRIPIFMVFIFCMMATFSFLAASNMDRSVATSMSGFKAGNIISDAVMGNYNSMSKDAIQQFLTAKNPCSNRNYNQYKSLKAQYPNTDWHWANDHFVCLSEERFGDGIEVGSGQTAAEIIYQAAQDYRINPQVLIVLLEKEQGLITDSFPNSVQYRSATGYGCPDTAACNTKYYGFKNQVRNAAALFRNVLDYGYSVYPEKRHGVYVRYSPNASCGSSEVYIENRATAALYRYTPYQPNAAAIAANYGQGDVCSAYGNRNFYLYFTDWFGSTQIAVDGTEIAIPDGIYGLSPKTTTGTTMAVAKSGKVNDSNILLSQTKGSTSNQWKFTRDSATGYYTIINVNSGLALDLHGGVPSTGANISLWTPNNTCAQKWRVYQTPDKYLTFESACSGGMVLDRYGNNTQDGTNIQLWTASANNDAQKWAIYTGQSVPNGMYAIQSKAIPGDKVVDVSNGGTNNGTNLQMWSFDHQSIAQKWDLTYDPYTDSYIVTNHGSKKGLDINGGYLKAGTNIHLWDKNASCSQRWKLLELEKGYYNLMNACDYRYGLDVFGGSAKNNGTNIQLWDFNTTDAQKWQFRQIPMIDDGVYNIVSAINDNKAMDVYGALTNVGANVNLWDRNFDVAQEWKITYNSSKQAYTLTNPHSNKVLYLAGARTGDGTNIELGNADGSCAQFWKLEQYADSSYSFVSTCAPSSSIDLNGGATHNGANINLWGSNSTSAQRWFFRSTQAVNDGTYAIVSALNGNKAIDVYGGNVHSNANVNLWDRNGTIAQKWKITYNPEKRAYSLVNPTSGKALYLADAKTTNGTNIQLGNLDSTCASYWKINRSVDSSIMLLSACASNRALDLNGGGTANGSNINLWEANYTGAQKWYLH